MYNTITSSSPTGPLCCDDMLLYNISNGAWGTESCGFGGGCSASWCVGNQISAPESLNCGSDSCSGGCCSTGGGDGGGGGNCVPSGGGCSSDDQYCDGETCVTDGYCTVLDPIIVDLTGKGYQLTTAANGVSFDFFGYGKPVLMSWTPANWNGGFLALDRNGNGKIDNGSELFSNVSPQPAGRGTGNGFLALAVYDQPANGGNNNGWIDPGDSIYSKLLVWVDKNHDGISQPDELLTLKQAGIESISLNYSSSQWTDAYGNTFRYRSQLTANIPNDQWVYDVLLRTASMTSAPTAATKPQ